MVRARQTGWKAKRKVNVEFRMRPWEAIGSAPHLAEASAPLLACSWEVARNSSAGPGGTTESLDGIGLRAGDDLKSDRDTPLQFSGKALVGDIVDITVLLSHVEPLHLTNQAIAQFSLHCSALAH